MSIKITRGGILDTIQDAGRFGYRHLGINPGGVMDQYSASIANILVGNSWNEGVIELHFPSSTFLFERPAVIALTGADFTAQLDNKLLQRDTAIHVSENSILHFERSVSGARCYMAIAGELNIKPWLGSNSTNLKAKVGGLDGRRLMKDDRINFRKEINEITFQENKNIIHGEPDENPDEFLFIVGPEWEWLSTDAKEKFLTQDFFIQSQSDRMGYKMKSEPLDRSINQELVSSPVCFGTVQLLPDGQLVVLMADHQTTGGYPRIATVISAHHSKLAQKKAGDKITFRETDLAIASQLFFSQHQQLINLEKQIQNNSR